MGRPTAQGKDETWGRDWQRRAWQDKEDKKWAMMEAAGRGEEQFSFRGKNDAGSVRVPSERELSLGVRQ
jgi:hypothetical protein